MRECLGWNHLSQCGLTCDNVSGASSHQCHSSKRNCDHVLGLGVTIVSNRWRFAGARAKRKRHCHSSVSNRDRRHVFQPSPLAPWFRSPPPPGRYSFEQQRPSTWFRATRCHGARPFHQKRTFTFRNRIVTAWLGWNRRNRLFHNYVLNCGSVLGG